MYSLYIILRYIFQILLPKLDLGDIFKKLMKYNHSHPNSTNVFFPPWYFGKVAFTKMETQGKRPWINRLTQPVVMRLGSFLVLHHDSITRAPWWLENIHNYVIFLLILTYLPWFIRSAFFTYFRFSILKLAWTMLE